MKPSRHNNVRRSNEFTLSGEAIASIHRWYVAAKIPADIPKPKVKPIQAKWRGAAR